MVVFVGVEMEFVEMEVVVFVEVVVFEGVAVC